MGSKNKFPVNRKLTDQLLCLWLYHFFVILIYCGAAAPYTLLTFYLLLRRIVSTTTTKKLSEPKCSLGDVCSTWECAKSMNSSWMGSTPPVTSCNVQRAWKRLKYPIFCLPWWARYQGQEGFAPATYLKKSTDPYAKSLVEKSKQSGVKIISNLADVSNLMASTTSPRNSSHFSSNSPRDSANVDLNALPGGGVQAGAGGQGKASDDELEEEKDIVHRPGPKGDSYAVMVVKQCSLERGGSLRPPPRRDSIKVGVGLA